jgi:SAM-dependent methyltransferase
MKYDASYQNEQAVSRVFQRHIDTVTRMITRHFGGASLIEVGCGKGHFLEHLQAAGFQITGLDPSYEGTNPSVIPKYFTPEIGLRADGIVLRHVLEHILDPISFLADIRDANGGSGKIYIEVPCLEWICEHRCWFDIFYEHVNYFRLSDFTRMFGTVDEATHTFHGQYLSVVADLSTIRIPVIDQADRFEMPVNLTSAVRRHAAKLMMGRQERSAYTVIWGGASKGVIFALYMQRAGATIDAVIDINPAKQGKYLAGSGLQVKAPEEVMRLLPDGSDIFVMNGNYLDEIVALTENRFNYLLAEE